MINNKTPQIKILQADQPPFALKFKVKEVIGVGVINTKGLTSLSKSLIKEKIVICA